MNKPVFEVTTAVTVNQVRKEKLDISQGKGISPALQKGWGLALVNRTPLVCVMVRTKNNQGEWGKWWDIPSIPHNCDLDSYSACVKAGKFTVFFGTECTSPAFSFQIADQPDSQNMAHVFEWVAKPDCTYAGGAFGVDP